VIDPRGRTVAALNATAPAGRVRSNEIMERFLPLLREAADDLQPVLV
jgi:DNA-binding IclR family transcriptional regulator